MDILLVKGEKFLENKRIKVANKSDLPSGVMKHFEVDGKEILLVNLKGKYYAVSDRCGHENARLSMGTLNDNIVTCPMHLLGLM